MLKLRDVHVTNVKIRDVHVTSASSWLSCVNLGRFPVLISSLELDIARQRRHRSTISEPEGGDPGC